MPAIVDSIEKYSIHPTLYNLSLGTGFTFTSGNGTSKIHTAAATIGIAPGYTLPFTVQVNKWDNHVINDNDTIIGNETDSVYVAYGCYSGDKRWYFSGDTVYVDTCFLESNLDSLIIICCDDPTMIDTIINVNQFYFPDAYNGVYEPDILYNYTWTAADINGDEFGTDITFYMDGGEDTIFIDAIKITVYYDGTSVSGYAGDIRDCNSVFYPEPWRDTINGVGLPDDTYTWTRKNYSYQQVLRAVDFGFTLPPDAVIDSFNLSYEGHSSFGYPTISWAVVYPHGTVTGDIWEMFGTPTYNYASIELEPGSYFPPSHIGTPCDTTIITCGQIYTTGNITGDTANFNYYNGIDPQPWKRDTLNGWVYLTDTSDFVGIGTAFPEYNLDIKGTLGVEHYFSVNAIGTEEQRFAIDADNSGITGKTHSINYLDSNYTSGVVVMDSNVFINEHLTVGGDILYTNTHWDDLTTSAVQAKINPVTSKPTYVSDSLALRWDAGDTTTNFTDHSFQFRHSYKQGTGIYAHVHYWQHSASDTCEWMILTYRWTDLGETRKAYTRVRTTNQTVFPYTSGSLQQLAAFPVITDGAAHKESSIFDCKLYVWSNGQLYTSQLDIHFEMDKPGTYDEYPE